MPSSHNPRRPSGTKTRRCGLEYAALEARQLLAASPIISELMASNAITLDDGYGSSSDWIELGNVGDAPIDLAGYHLTDNALDPTQWTFTQSTLLQPGEHLVVFASSRNEIDPLGFHHTNFKLSAGGEYVGLYDPDGSLISEIGSASTDYPPQVTDVSYGRVGGSLVNGQSTAQYLVPSKGSLGTTWTANGFNATANGFSTGRAAVGYENSPGDNINFLGEFETDLDPAGRSITSVYLRTEFEIEDASSIDDLTLLLNYDDGFAVYLNGTFLFSENAPASLAWNSSATQAHNDSDALRAVSFGLDGGTGSEGDFLNLLVDGTNTLAIHSLNRPNSSDMLLVPTLVSNSIGGPATYLRTPTPGQANSAPVTLGPEFDNVTPSATPAAAGQAFAVTAEISEFDRPVDSFSARLHYRVIFGAEATLPMNDAGLGSDLVAGDGIYTATIPGSALAAGELLRWYVSVADVDGNLSREPRFLDPLNSPEYFGTVVADPAIVSELPVFQWFVENTAGASTDAGARGSLFFNGKFYDNIRADAHGQSTRGPDFPKKSFDFDANSGQKFDLGDIIGKASDFNLLTNFADQTKIRNGLAYDTFAQAGIESLHAFPVVVYRNGDYYGLYDIVEEGDEEYLSRTGLDPNGALYKVNSPLNSVSNRVEKKSREYESFSDFQNVVNGRALSGTAAATWRFDNLDIAKTINYLAVQNLIASHDFGHKNMYWYRDSDGTGLWNPLPWDQDLSFGHKWNGNLPQRYFDNSLVRNQTLTAGWNDLFQRMFSDSTMREMYNRRLRTLTDQLFGAPGTPVSQSYLYQKITELGGLTDEAAVEDLAEWGINPQFAAAYPFNPGQAIDQLRDVYLLAQRNHVGNQGFVPDSQPLNPAITFDTDDYDASPTSGLQSEEYIRLRNNNNTAIDISGWRLTGGIEHTFHGGTVIPAGGSLYVVADIAAFKNRTTAPRGGQQRFIQGNYSGQLSSDGDVVNLVATSGATIDTLTTPAEGPSDNQQFLRITEFNYNPTDPAGNAEFIEFTNISNGPNATSLNLAGVTISEGPSTPFEFPSGTILPAGSRIVVVKDVAAFNAAYPDVDSSLILGTYEGSLSNRGERIRVDDFGGERILEFTYGDSDPWSPVADGAGGTLQLVDEANTPVDLLDKFYSWRGSYREGTPTAGPDSANANVVISEVLAHTDEPQVDFIELHNRGSNAIDIGGWYLSDSKANLQKFQIPSPTVIATGGYVVFDESDFNPTPLTPGPGDFALSSEGDQVWLTSTLGGQTAFIDAVAFGATFNGESVGPAPVQGGRLSPLLTATPGTANSAERVGPLLITEVHYHPTGPTAAELAIDANVTASDFEFVEIHNPTSATASLQDWRLRGGVDYDFESISIAAGTTILVLRFNPEAAENSDRLALFRNRHGIGLGVTLVGGYDGSLSNSFARIELQQPDTPDPSDLTAIPHVTADEVLYDDRAPWADADGNGQSLQRIAENMTGNSANNWAANAPTLGSVSLIVAAPQVTSMVRDGGGVLIRPDLIESVSFSFDTDVTISPGALEVRNLTTGGTLVDVSSASFNYSSALRTAIWDFSTTLPAGFYQLTILPSEVSGADSAVNMAAGYVQEIHIALAGDANLDGRVDVLGDGFQLVSNLGITEDASWADGDFDGDDDVDVLGDAFRLVANLGRSIIPTAKNAVFTFANPPASQSFTSVTMVASHSPMVSPPKARLVAEGNAQLEFQTPILIQDSAVFAKTSDGTKVPEARSSERKRTSLTASQPIASFQALDRMFEVDEFRFPKASHHDDSTESIDDEMENRFTSSTDLSSI